MQIFPLIRFIEGHRYWCTPLWQKPIFWSVSLCMGLLGWSAVVIAMTVILGITLETFATLAITAFLTALILNMSFTVSGRREMSKKVDKLKIKAKTATLTDDEQEKIDNKKAYDRTYLLFGILAVFVSATLGGAFALGVCDYLHIVNWFGYVLMGIATTFLWSVGLWAILIQGAADGENYTKVIKPTYDKVLAPVADKVEKMVDDSAVLDRIKSMSFAEVMELMSRK